MLPSLLSCLWIIYWGQGRRGILSCPHFSGTDTQVFSCGDWQYLIALLLWVYLKNKNKNHCCKSLIVTWSIHDSKMRLFFFFSPTCCTASVLSSVTAICPAICEPSNGQTVNFLADKPQCASWWKTHRGSLRAFSYCLYLIDRLWTVRDTTASSNQLLLKKKSNLIPA